MGKVISNQTLGKLNKAIQNAEKASPDELKAIGKTLEEHILSLIGQVAISEHIALSEVEAQLANFRARPTNQATGKLEADYNFQIQAIKLGQQVCTTTNALMKKPTEANAKANAEAWKALEAHCKDYSKLVPINPNASNKRTDFRVMLFFVMGGHFHGLHLFFGGWKDKPIDNPTSLRKQFGFGRLIADANSKLDGDKVVKKIDDKDTMTRVMQGSSPYNFGQPVQQPKSTGWEVSEKDLAEEIANKEKSDQQSESNPEAK